jgi:hypothetical protein
VFARLNVARKCPKSDNWVVTYKGRSTVGDKWRFEYAWRVKRTVTGDQLKLEVLAEATEWVIEGTIKDASDPYHPAKSDKDWFKTSTFAPPPPPPNTP